MRLTVCLEGNSEGRVLASVDMEEIVKMTITDDIEKSNFNPQMLKNCKDTSYQCGYQQGREDAMKEHFRNILDFINTSNRGNCDYFIVDQIENYIGDYMKEENHE